MPLSDFKIKAAKPSQRRTKLSDGGGMSIEISPKGVKTWKLAYRFGGKQRTISGGRYPDVTLAEARTWREECKKSLRAGIDPTTAVLPQIEPPEIIESPTFEAVAREWHEKNKGTWRPKHADWIIGRLEHDAFPTFGKTSVSNVGRQHILTLIRRFESRGALEMAKKCLGFVDKIMRYAAASGWVERNPVPDVKVVMKPKPKVQHRAKLSATDLPAFYSRLDHATNDTLTKLALRWTILTMVRTNETRFFRPEEIEGRGTEEVLWRIPASRMKMKDDHIVPIPPQGVVLLDQIEKIARASGSQWQFPQLNNPDKPFSENCMLYCLYDLGYKGVATVHGFRGMASTILNEQVKEDGSRRFDADWIEMQLAHDERNAVRGAYNAAKYLAPRRAMMRWWADFLADQEAFGALL